MFKKSMLLSVLLLTFSVAFADDNADIKALKKDMPQDVVLMIDRIIQCNHWNAEEPKTKERIDQVKKVLDQLHCDALPKEQTELLKRYQNNYQVALYSFHLKRCDRVRDYVMNRILGKTFSV